ncbi:MAG: DUF4139 domain-containing protein [Deltaproteobacteria bacterium]|nr:DUF4139 domain-containing protein [Deltaproteobacteria bacterium]
MSAVVVPSEIQAVQVYRRGATVVRRAVVDGDALASGLPDEIELAGLPLSLLDPTVKVRVLEVEPASSSVTAAGVRVGLFVRGGGERPVSPEQKVVDALARQLRAKEELVRLIDNEIGLLQGIPVPERPSAEEGRAPPPAPLQMRLALEGFADDAALRRRAERRSLATEMRQLEEELRKQQERIAASSSAAEVHQGDLTKAAVISLRGDGERPSRVVVELSYVVPGARWTPAYQVKLARDGSKAVIQLRAHIAQKSGEDWKGVKLRLSTALPLRFTELPELSSIRIGKAQPAPAKKGFRPPPAGGEVLFRDFDRDRARVKAAVPPPRPWHMPALEAPLEDLVDAAPVNRPPPRPKRVAAPEREMMVDRSELSKAAYVGGAMDDDDSDSLMAESAAPPPPPAQRMAYAPAPAPPSASASAGPGAGGARGRVAAKPVSNGVDEVAMAMVFPLLRLPAGAESQRGRLVPVDLRSLYSQSLARFGRPVPFDVLSAVQNAEREAMTAGTSPPPMTVDINDLSSFYDFVYEADGVVDVAGDGGYHSVSLGEREGAASVRYVAVPREELSVYRTAVIQNPLSAPLLSGPAEVYVGGDYVLTTALPTVSLRGELKLGLGVEQAIKIARNARFSETRTGEGVVAMVELSHDVDIDIVNHLGRAIDIEVRERVPVPLAGAEVQVDERTITPPWEPYTQEERDAVVVGGRRWLLQVPAGASQKLNARYVLKLFSNSEVSGGNRRER